MKIVEIITEYGPTPTRFQKQSDSAMFNGKPTDPKKILMALKNSLNHATEMNFKLTPTLISQHGYVGEFRYDNWNNSQLVDKDLVITLEVSWYRDGSKGKPVVIAKIHNSHDEMTLFKYRVEIDEETISNMWSPMTVHTIHEYVTEEETYYDTDEDEDWDGN